VPVVADAAFLSFPFARFGAILADGADLAIFSAKYFGGPNTGGFICGRKDLLAAVAQLDFTGHGPHNEISFGRAFKLDRQLVVGVVVALAEWRELDHEARWEGYERLVGRIAGALRDVPGIALTPLCYTMEETLAPEPINALAVRVDQAGDRTAARVEAALAAGTPRVLVHRFDDQLVVDVECLTDDEAVAVGQRLRAELGG
jgi:L-seryl-tRNA(Ser) seleniumtransferase